MVSIAGISTLWQLVVREGAMVTDSVKMLKAQILVCVNTVGVGMTVR